MAVETERSIHPGNGYGFGQMNLIPTLSDMHPDTMDDYEGNSGGKMGGRSGRRKQNKPIRVFMDSDPAEGEMEATAPTHNNADIEASSAVKDKHEVDIVTSDMITCDLCTDTFDTQSALTDHIESVHQIDNDDNQENFPTKYHQLGSELQHEFSLSALEEGIPRSALLPKPTFSNGSDSNSSSDGKKSNIFHQDAYCELCDREFCNKYFLKTHKANKHGVFDNSPCSSPTNGSLPALIPLRMDDEDIPMSSSSSPKDLSTPVILPILPKYPAPTPPTPTKPKESLTNQVPTPNLTSSALSIPSIPPALEQRASDKPSLDMEDYCELCQKHFCNKYYLKKHKQDVHGIVPEDTPGAKRARPSHNGSPMSVSSASPNPLLLPQNASPLTSSAVNGNGAIPGLSNMANVMFINPFGPPLALLQPQQLNPAGFPPHLAGLPLLPQPMHGAESPKTSLVSSMSPNSCFPLTDPLRLPDPLRLMGGEVSCDICKKEFCNKYFLKIHKASKHGMPMDDMPLMLPGLPGLPPNLNLSDPNGKELGEMPIKREHTSPSSPDDLKARQSPVETCIICNKNFPNQHSLKVHLVNAHNQRLSDFDLLPELSKAESLSAGLLGSTMFNNMMAAKLADRVLCDICNKEVCNKYFLKTHKVKVHGMDPAQVDRELNMMPLSMSMPPMSSPSQMPFMPRLPTKEIPIPPPSEPVPRPSDSELLKMGIDPEAYCEICKKEFCSKYFLKTHKWNLHGIKTDGSPPITIRVKERELPPLPISIMPGLPPPSPNNGRRNWKWKEPANSMRVMCELCNKELCNKYFLKTHMLNKHGINIDVSAGAPGFPMKSVMPNPPPLPGFPLPPFPFPGFMKDENSNNSMPSTASSSENGVMEPKKAEPAEADHFQIRMKEQTPMDMHTSDIPTEPQYSPNVLSAKTWSVPDIKPIVADLEEAMNLTNPARLKESFPAQEDKHKETIKTSEGEFPVLKCSICGMMFGEKDTLQLHMAQDHQDNITPSSDQTESLDGSTCQKNTSITNLGLSLKRKYQFGVRRKAQHMQKLKRLGGGVSIAEKVKSAIVNHIQNHLKRKKFKCAFCQEKFSLRSLCQQHIRSKHKRETSASGEIVSDDSSNSAQKQATVQQKPGSDSTIMQPFTVEDTADGGNFARSVVYLPVYNKISEPLSVTFNLTPAQN